MVLISLHPSVCMQSKYKEDGLKSLPQNLYSHLPETNETQFVKSVSELLSEVRKSLLVSSTFLWCCGWNPRRFICFELSFEICCYISDIFRLNTRRRVKRRRAAACTTSCLKLWRLYTLKRPRSCRARYAGVASSSFLTDALKQGRNLSSCWGYKLCCVVV